MKKILHIFLLCLVTGLAGAQGYIESTDWQLYSNEDDIKIEYKSVDTLFRNREINVIVFRYTNNGSSDKMISFNREIYRGDECANCNDEYQNDHKHYILIKSNEVITGEESIMDNEALYAFNYFKVKVPGMTAKNISDFRLINLNITDK